MKLNLKNINHQIHKQVPATLLSPGLGSNTWLASNLTHSGALIQGDITKDSPVLDSRIEDPGYGEGY